MNRLVVAAGSVAAVVLLAVVGLGFASGGGVFGPGATPSPSPTPAPSQLTDGAVEPGRYFLDSDGYRYTFTVPESGWTFNADFVAVTQGEDSEIAIFWPSWFAEDVESLYRRACRTGHQSDDRTAVGSAAQKRPAPRCQLAPAVVGDRALHD